ncbi:MAG TPA: HAMP domain-containing sensor histidine kinase [Steroidobacteraceae bacterium]|nr:HAMP domain-containing sensor histidine kinase [Steroidobacteraceae bacterium]
MKKKSHLATTQRNVRWLAGVATLWVLLLIALMAWWGWVVREQSQRIVELERVAGLDTSVADAQWQVTQRMLAWEGGTLLVLLAGLSIALVWLYLRDQRRTNALRAFFASVTHELRTPLTSIRLQAESLADSGNTSPLVERLLEDTSRLEAQVEKTLELARIEGGGELDLQPLPIQAWLQRQVQSKAAARAVQIELSTPNPDGALVLADRSALEIIFRNLIENTARHSDSTPARARIAARENGAEVVVSFTDAGRGFAGEAQRLGSLFFRGQRSQGAGVGLYLIRMLMQRMGGHAEFDSRPGAGFETRLHFRRAEETA